MSNSRPIPLLSWSLPFTVGLLLAVAALLPRRAQAQNNSAYPSEKAVKVLTDSLASQLTKHYVDREAAIKMGAAIRKKFKGGHYKNIKDVHVLAGQLTADLLEVHHDEHLHVEYNPILAHELSGNIEDVPRMVAGKLQRDRWRNFGFRKVEILNGNIGYLELSGFSRLNQYSKATADAALRMLSNAGAIIIDLRYGVGGSPDMMTHILSHFYKERLHISDIYIRSEDTRLAYYTTPDSSYGRLTEIPLYVLTSYKTFSAAEGLAYALQSTGRAKVVGEITRGGAHTVTYRPLSSGFVVDVPFGRAESPLTGKNWEKVGITPDIITPAAEALETAQFLILDQALAASTDSAERRMLRWGRDLARSVHHPVQLDPETIQQLTGTYGPYCLSYSDGCLYYQKTGKARFPLIPMSASALRVKGSDQFVVELQRDTSGMVTRVITIYDDGRSETGERTR